ncbi:MAG TPA: alpha/beta hydrolase [Streptosporangiaceae bacterium]|nr:alpha/beta hydrolase [Streptosporangiaceae bacterium]
MPRPPSAWAAVAVAAAAALTACSGPPPPATLATYYTQHLDWQPCDGGFQCAELVVPFDYARPAGPRFTLPVVKLPAADPAHRIGALVVNPGGPGGSGVQYALAARQAFPPAILARFDLVGFDPRGAGASQPALNCENGPQLDTFFGTDDEPADPAQLARVVAASEQFAAQCERHSAALLPVVGTPNAARDLDVLRSALGQSRLTYLGKSYGTYLGAWYAQLFPQRVRALVLDGSVDPAASSLEATIAQAQGFQGAFGSFAAWCLAAAGCPLGASVAAAESKVDALITRANSVPLANHLGDGQVADGAMLLYGVADALYSRSSWPALKNALGSAFTGDGTPLVDLANQLYGRNPNGTYSTLANAVTAIDCLDKPWPRTLAAWQSAASAAAKAAPMFGAALVWGSLTCAYWPVASYPQPRLKAAGAPPILVVGTLRDPATPYRWAQAMAGDLASGVLLGWNGDGHTAYGEGSACVDAIVNAYLIDLAVPRSGTVCQH